MGLFTRFRMLKNLSNKTNHSKTKSLNGYDVIREKLGEGNTLTVKNPAVINERSKNVSFGL